MASLSSTSEDDDKSEVQDQLSTQRLSFSHCAASWSLEISASVASTGIIIAIACILATWNGRPINAWGSPITLNALLSTLVTFLYLFLMVTIAKCLSQLKWNYFVHDPHALQDMVLFDDASRSAWGSFLLLTKRSRSVRSTFAAFLTIAVAAIGPFVQQILQSELVPYEVTGKGHAIIVNRTSITDDQDWTNPTNWLSSDANGTTQAVFSGLLANTVQDFLVTPDCSGNCTWESIWTFAVESECKDVTKQLIDGNVLYPGGFPEPKLPNGFQIFRNSTQHSKNQGHFNLTASYPSLVFKDRGYVLADFFYLWTFDWNSPAVAVECILQLVGHNLKAVMQNSNYTENKLGSSLVNNTRGARLCSPWLYYMAQNAPYNTTDDVPLDEVKSTYLDVDLCDLLLHDENRKVTLDFSLGKLDLIPGELVEVLTSNNAAYGPDVAFANSMTTALGSAELSLQDRVDNVAKSISRAMRQTLLGMLPVATTDVRKDVVLFVVVWPWITLPASLVALTYVLLLITILDTHKKNLPKWTDNALALIAYGGYRAIEPAMHHGADLETLEDFARQQKVQMSEDGVLAAKF